MTPAVAKRLRLLASALSLLAVAVLLAVGWFYFRLRASLPQLDGPVAHRGGRPAQRGGAAGPGQVTGGHDLPVDEEVEGGRAGVLLEEDGVGRELRAAAATFHKPVAA